MIHPALKDDSNRSINFKQYFQNWVILQSMEITHVISVRAALLQKSCTFSFEHEKRIKLEQDELQQSAVNGFDEYV